MIQSSFTESEEGVHAANEHVIIWHDPYIYSSTKVQYIRAIKMICNVRLFSEWKAALRYLKETRPASCESCLVITSRNNGELLVKEIFNLDSINSIYVFDDDNQQAPLGWIKHYPKIMCTERKFTALFNKICENIQPCLSVTSSNMTNQLNREEEKGKEEIKEDETEDVIILARVDEMIKLFVKESLVIWFDPKATSPENRNKIDAIKDVCDIRTFTDWKEATKCLKETQVPFCQVVISDANAEIFVKEITCFKCVSSIYMLSENDVAISNHSWMSQYEKVLNIENDFMSIANKIKVNIDKWRMKNSSLRTDLPSFATLFNDMDRSEENYRHYYLKDLTKFGNRRQAKEDFLALANALYGKKQDIHEFKQIYTDYDMKSILKWYTKESFLYKLTNNCLRVANFDSIQYCRLPLRNLETAIKEKYKQQSQKFTGLLYRGAYMSDKEWMRLQQNTGKDIEMYGFLSTSKNKDAAISFCQEDLTKKVFITIIVLNGKAKDEQGFAEVKEYSDYPDEDEVIFNIRSRFTVLEANVEEIDRSEIHHLVLLYGAQAMRIFTTLESPVIQIQLRNKQISACGVCRQNIKFDDDSVIGISISNPSEYTCHSCLYSHKMSKLYPLLCIKPSAHGLSNSLSESDRSVNLTLKGSVMQNKESMDIVFYGYKCSICQISKSNGWYTCLDCEDGKISYCNKCFFVEQNKKCNKEKHMIIFEGHPFSFWSEKILENEIHRLKYHEQTSKEDKMYWNQTKLFFNTHNYKEVAELCEKYLNRKPELKEQISAEKICTLYNDLGLAYSSLGEYQKAINYYSQSLEIAKEVFGKMHPNTAVSLNNLGLECYSLGEYQKAIDYYSQSLEIQKAALGNKHTTTATIFSNLGLVYYSLGEYQKAIDYYSQSLEIQKEALGDKHPSTANSFDHLGSAYCSSGEYQKAIDYYSLSLEIYKAVFGGKHPHTATSFNNLGSAFYSLGEYQKAIDNYFLSLEIRKDIFGENHPHTAISFNNLGSTYYSLGEYKKAIEYYSLSLEIRKAAFGKKHRDIATSFNNLGSTYYSLGEYQKAIEYYSLSLEIDETIFGHNHPQIALSFNNLGSAYDSLGEYQKAIEYYSLSLDIKKTMFGEKHPDTAISFNNLGLAYKSLGEYQKAIEYYSLSLAIHKEVFGEKHPDTATSLSNLGSVYEKLGEYQNAIDYHSQSLQIIKAIFGDNHPSTANSYNNLGTVYEKLGEYQKAIDYHSLSLEIYKTIFGEKHPDTAISFNNLGSAYDSLGEYQKAIEYYSLSLAIHKEVFGEKHPDTATSFNNLGLAYKSLGEYQKAIEYYSLSLEIYKTIFGHNHPHIALSFNNLGSAYESLGKYQKAIEYYSLSLEIHKAVFGDNHSDTATSFNNLGSAYYRLGEYQKAINYHSLSLEIRKAIFGDNHPSTANSYNNLGTVYEKLGEYKTAIDYYSLSLEICKAMFGEKHPDTAASFHNLGSAYYRLGQYQKAIEYYFLSLEICQIVFGEKHPTTATSFNNLGSAYYSLGKYQKSIEYYSLSLKIRITVFGEKHPDTVASVNNIVFVLQFGITSQSNDHPLSLTYNV